MGVPGLPAPSIGIDAEIDALKDGVASFIPILTVLHHLKKKHQDLLSFSSMLI